MVVQVELAHLPPELAVYAAYYANVENASFLRDQLLAGNTDFEYAFIDASMIISMNHVLAAVFRALNDYLNDRLKSRNIHSEIVFALSPNNNIGEAFRRFGVSEATKHLIVLKVATKPEVNLSSVQSHLGSAVKGEERAFADDELKDVTDTSRLRKVYKLPTVQKPPPKKSLNGEVDQPVDDRHDLEVQIIGLMALRGAT